MVALSTDLTTYDESFAKLLADMANKDDSGGNISGPPTLKINYDEDSIFPRGEWVVGQKKGQDGLIVEHGVLVKAIIILLVRNRWSYYNNKDTTKNCNSPFYLRGEMVRGNKYGYVCGKSCPMRAEGLQPRCKCQIALFGKAVTEKGELIECVSYLGGDSFMPVQDYINSIEKARAKGGYVQIPLFSRLTLLGSTKKVNEGTKYFVAELKDGGMFKDIERVKGFAADRDSVIAWLERANSVSGEVVDETSGTATPPEGVSNAGHASKQVDDIPDKHFEMPESMATQNPMAAIIGAGVQPDPVVDVKITSDPSVPDFAKIFAEGPGVTSEPPKEPWADVDAATVPQPSGGDFDLIGAIESLIGK